MTITVELYLKDTHSHRTLKHTSNNCFENKTAQKL